ncbi:MAG: hypothetical protein ACTHLN_07240 [Tepidisphaeraceae bacterium]
MELILVILAVVAAILIAAALFVGWLVVRNSRAFGRFIIPARRPMPLNSNVQLCTNRQCACDNPAHARFCRRCGKSLPNMVRLIATQAAVL